MNQSVPDYLHHSLYAEVEANSGLYLRSLINSYEKWLDDSAIYNLREMNERQQREYLSTQAKKLIFNQLLPYYQSIFLNLLIKDNRIILFKALKLKSINDYDNSYETLRWCYDLKFVHEFAEDFPRNERWVLRSSVSPGYINIQEMASSFIGVPWEGITKKELMIDSPNDLSELSLTKI